MHKFKITVNGQTFFGLFQTSADAVIFAIEKSGDMLSRVSVVRVDES